MTSGPTDSTEAFGEPEPTVIRDKRRIDPTTGEVRQPEQDVPGAAEAAPGAAPAEEGSADATDAATPDVTAEGSSDLSAEGASGLTAEGTSEAAGEGSSADSASLADAAAALAQERLGDLQRLQAEYVNYRKRVERDRDVARDQGVYSVLESLLPVLDDIELARQHGDLVEGPFASIADKLEQNLGRSGLVRFGAVGDEFDPMIHEALLHNESDEVTTTSVTQVLQPGYRAGERVLRPARVGVTSPA